MPEKRETDRFTVASSSGLEDALAMYAHVSDARVRVQMTAEGAACIVILDAIGRKISERMAAGMLDWANGLTEAARAVATHYRFLRTICTCRGLEADWKEYEDAMRKIPRTAMNLEAMEKIEALEADVMVSDILERLGATMAAVNESKPSTDPHRN